MTIEARYAASARGSSPHRNASDVFGGVSVEVADRNRRVFGMSVHVLLWLLVQTKTKHQFLSKYLPGNGSKQVLCSK
jgi:hypothetical protein